MRLHTVAVAIVAVVVAVVAAVNDYGFFGLYVVLIFLSNCHTHTSSPGLVSAETTYSFGHFSHF